MKKTIGVRLDIETISAIEEYGNGATISEKIRNRIESQFFTKQHMEEKIKQIDLQKKAMLDMLKNNIFSKEFEMDEKEKEWLEESASWVLVEENIPNIHYRHRFYNNHFTRNVTLSDFKLKMRELQDKLNIKRDD